MFSSIYKTGGWNMQLVSPLFFCIEDIFYDCTCV